MNFISIDDGVAGLVCGYEDIIEDGVHTITYNGIELKGLATKRIVIPEEGIAYQHYSKKSPEYVIAQLLEKQLVNPTDTSRRIYSSILEYEESTTKITYDGRYQGLADEIESLATAYNIGWCAYIKDSQIVWKIWHGTNRSAEQNINNRMILDYEYGTMNNNALTFEDTIPNYMVVAGQGEGAARAIANIDKGSVGFERKEVFLDARDIEDNSLLPQRGEEKLAEYGDNISYTASLSNQGIKQYRKDYDLGDIGTIRDEKISGYLNYRITAIEEVYENNMVSINLTFGYEKNQLKDAVKRMNSKRDALLAVENYGGSNSASITDDGSGNIIITGSITSITDDGNGNVSIA